MIDQAETHIAVSGESSARALNSRVVGSSEISSSIVGAATAITLPAVMNAPECRPAPASAGLAAGLRWRSNAGPLLGGGDKRGRQSEAGDKEGTQ